MSRKKQVIHGIEYYIISERFDRLDGSIDGFVLIDVYERPFRIVKDENPEWYDGFTVVDGVPGPRSEELNMIDFDEIVCEFYKEVL
jgi:hypothetical protein